MPVGVYPRPPLRERLLSRLIIDWDTGCWNWAGYKDRRGYGRIQVNKRPVATHRLAWEMLIGPIPDGLELDHLCRNTACANPAHLEPVTQAENNRRSRSPSALNAAKTRCIRGHLFDEANTYVGSRGKRYCRACNCIKSRQYRARRAAAA